VDVQTLLTSKTIVPLLKDFIAAGNNSDPAAIDDNQAAGAGKLLAGAIEGTTIKVTRWIGTTDKLYHKLALDALLKLDARAFGGPGTTTVSTQFSITLTQVGQPITVTAPIPPPAGADALLLATIPPDDAVIPETAFSRFAGIPEGVTGNGQGPGTFPYLGNPSAPIKMMQFSSFSCSACRDYYNAVVVNLLPAIRAGQVQYIFVPVTLTGEYDPTSETAAALCALDQGRYWEMHDTLFNWRSRYESAAADPHRLEVAALKLGLNPDKFLSCVSSQAIRARIGADDDYFDTLGFFDTPSVAINGKPLDTPPDLNQVYQMIASSQTNTTPQAGTPTFSTPAPFLGPTPTVSDNNQAGPLT